MFIFSVRHLVRGGWPTDWHGHEHDWSEEVHGRGHNEGDGPPKLGQGCWIFPGQAQHHRESHHLHMEEAEGSHGATWTFVWSWGAWNWKQYCQIQGRINLTRFIVFGC